MELGSRVESERPNAPVLTARMAPTRDEHPSRGVHPHSSGDRAPRVRPAVGDRKPLNDAAAQGSRCPHRASTALVVGDGGSRCMLPYWAKDGTLQENCSSGECAIGVDPLGRPLFLEKCSHSATPTDLACLNVTDAAGCDGDTLRSATCATVVDGGVCFCQSVGDRTRVVQVEVKRCSATTCERECAYLAMDLRSAAHARRTAKSREDRAVNHLHAVVGLAASLVPTINDFGATGATAFADGLRLVVPDPLEGEDRFWCGRGVVFMAGSPGTLPQVLATVEYMRTHLRTTLPVEVWQTHDEQTSLSDEFKNALRRLGIELRTLPAEVLSASTDELFALKPAVVLASSFDEVLFFDSDALPLVDPNEIFEQRGQGESAVFFPDLWTLLYDAKIFDSVPWPHEGNIGPSQESGVMVICKSCGGYRPLALSFYYNYYSDVFYEAIYFGHYNDRPGGRRGKHGHGAPGRGDKDTFQIAWLAAGAAFTMMGPAALGGVPLEQGLLCGSSFIHRSHTGKFLALHHNSNKWSWRDFHKGLFVASKHALHLSHFAAYRNPAEAFHADGIDLFKSVTYSNRADAGKQKPPEGTRWCIVYKGEVDMDTIESYTGWDPQAVLAQYVSTVYTAPWLVQWVLENTRESALQKCLRVKEWMSDRELMAASDDTLRNTVIVYLHNTGKGSVPLLQALSDRRLSEICLRDLPPVTAAPQSKRHHRKGIIQKEPKRG
eukprot:TRINITY_DN8994_c0_g1_i2.p1 TRINITY_DN8994_c0_g1~~TRINITY_DN8994_c0_g1_i2.p1  ORF type:complete len:720 (+),score=193.05 TRINITY_DN8994_c0_g1_i2:285-2444(+)